jgi:hypothetical protein
LVPRGLRLTIWRLYNSGNPKTGHREACRSAIEQVNARLKNGEFI